MNTHSFKPLTHPAIWHAITDRRMGNLARHTGDDPRCVSQNRRQLARLFLPKRVPIVWMDQVHGNRVVLVNRLPKRPPACDALITRTPHLALAVMVADCVPILFFDPDRLAVGVAHAGWRGTLASIAAKTVQSMSQAFGSDPASIRVGIGPAIGGECYEVDEAVAAPWREQLGERYLKQTTADHWHLDLPGANTDQLIAAGVKAENIERINICTHCDERFYSYRRGQERGRFAGVIALKRP